MNPVQISISLLISAAVPIIFLIIAYNLDLYCIHSLPYVVMAFLWGGILSLGFAYGVNMWVTLPLLAWLNLNHLLLYILFAPIVEELLKLTPLAYFLHRGRLSFFVDGAIYGFASGIGFSIGESFIYITRYPDLAIPLAIGRAFSTSLMHGAATALVGIGYGLARLRQVKSRKLLPNATWLVAVTLHALFNALVLSDPQDTLGALGAVAIALGGFELTLTFIHLGVKEEKRWLEESLDASTARAYTHELSPLEQQRLVQTLQIEAWMPLSEIQATQNYEQIRELLEPLQRQFPKQAHDMEQIIFQQAQIDIKRRLIWEVDDLKLQAHLEGEIGKLEADVEQLLKRIGPYASSYLNGVFDKNGKLMKVCVNITASCAAPRIAMGAGIETWERKTAREGRAA